MATKRIKGSIHEAQHDSEGNEKKNLEIATRGIYDFYMYRELGFEGRSDVLQTAMVNVDEKNRRNRYYLNHVYVKVKPDFSIMRYENTDDPMPKPNAQGNLNGVWQLKDVSTNEEMVLWTYTTPGDKSKWENLHTQISYIVNRVKSTLGKECVDADGYLPVIIKLGRMPTHMALKYAKVVGWDFAASDYELTQTEFNDFNHAKVEKMATLPPKIPNEYETATGELRQIDKLKEY